VPYQYKREPLSDDKVNRLTNACDAFGEKFVIWTLLGTDLMVSSLGGLWQQLLILRNGLYGHTFIQILRCVHQLGERSRCTC